jgi:hypothetical protein
MRISPINTKKLIETNMHAEAIAYCGTTGIELKTIRNRTQIIMIGYDKLRS